jgi:hypothetical protein
MFVVVAQKIIIIIIIIIESESKIFQRDLLILKLEACAQLLSFKAGCEREDA